MKSYIFKLLLNREIYWRSKTYLRNFIYLIRRSKYLTLEKLKSEDQSFSTLESTLIGTARTIAWAVAVTIGLQYLNKFALPHLSELGLPGPKENSDYVAFLSSVAGIGGVFIGLYYAALTSVGSAIYAKLPNDVRELLTKERRGSIYMRYLSWLTLLCITMIAFRISGQPIINIAIPIVAILSGGGILAFVKLGQNAFNLFDPTTLARPIFEDLYKQLSLVKVDGYQWSDPKFQSTASAQANRSIKTLKLLINLAAKEPHQNGTSLATLTCNTIRLLIKYECIKPQIPSDSCWYPLQYKHKDWYASSGNTVMIAHQSGTIIRPDTIHNLDWLENELYRSLDLALKTNLLEGRHFETTQILNEIRRYILLLASTGEIQKSFKLMNIITSDMAAALKGAGNPDLALSRLEQLSILNFITTLPANIALAITNGSMSRSPLEIKKALTDINWKRKSDIYKQSLPRHFLTRLEWLHTRIGFELLTEGRVVSPLWYQTEILCLSEAENISQYSLFIKESLSFFDKFYRQFPTNECLWLRASIHSSEHDFWHKSSPVLKALEQSWLAIKHSWTLPQLRWPTFDFEKLDADSNSARRTLVQAMATLGDSLASSDAPPDFPDYAGQFLHINGEAMLDALCSGDMRLAEDLFPKYLRGCFQRFDKLKSSSLPDFREDDTYRVAAAAIYDVMEVSGYAYLLSEYFNESRYWDSVLHSWNHFYSSSSNIHVTQTLLYVASLSRSPFRLPHRSDIRFEWGQKIASLLQNLPRKNTYVGPFSENSSEALHSSVIVRHFARSKSLRMPSGFNLFIALYFPQHSTLKSFDLDWEQRDLLKLLQLRLKSDDRSKGHE